MTTCSIKHLLWETARADKKRALPILSFPAVHPLGITVEELVHSAEYQAQAMELVANTTDTVAAVSPMDLSLEAEAFGASVRFAANEIPAITGQLVASEADADALAVPPLTAGRIPVAIEGVRLAKQRITSKPVLAGTIGPFSLAGRLMDVTEVMYTCYDEPETVHKVLHKAVEFLIAYIRSMKNAGADGVLMAEPLAGILSPDMAEEFSVPYVRKIIDAVQTDSFAVLYHNCGNSVPQMLPQIYSQGAAAYHFGNAVNLPDILAQTPADILCMGNIDPVSQFANGTPDSVREATRALLTACKGYKNFVPSSGCDIPAHTDWANIRAFFEAL